jgi:hypothetical protein
MMIVFMINDTYGNLSQYLLNVNHITEFYSGKLISRVIFNRRLISLRINQWIILFPQVLSPIKRISKKSRNFFP